VTVDVLPARDRLAISESAVLLHHGNSDGGFMLFMRGMVVKLESRDEIHQPDSRQKCDGKLDAVVMVKVQLRQQVA
jgi:hypothetical protein